MPLRWGGRDLPSSLGAVALPRGYREVRLELGCGACDPEHLVRIVADLRGRVRGEAFVGWRRPDDSSDAAADTLAVRIRRRHADWERDLRERARCVGELRPSATPLRAPGEGVWCRAGRGTEADWRRVLSLFDRLGLAGAARDPGPLVGEDELPDWSGAQPTPRRADARPAVPGLGAGGCRDIGGESLRLEGGAPGVAVPERILPVPRESRRRLAATRGAAAIGADGAHLRDTQRASVACVLAARWLTNRCTWRALFGGALRARLVTGARR